MTLFRSTVAEVDLGAIGHNVRTLKPSSAELMAVVKANGYGHGAIEVANAVTEAGASWLGVALVEEGVELRLGGLDVPILVLSELPPGAEAVALAHGLVPTVFSDGAIRRLASAVRGPIGVHVKVDTGMHRIGVWPPERTATFCDQVVRAGLFVEGVWTHFAKSETDDETTKVQLECFLEVVEAVRKAGHEPRWVHASNSGGVLRHPEADLDLVRPGIAVYGLPPEPGVGADRDLRPALAWRSIVTFARRLPAGERLSYGHRYELEGDAWVATVPVGYADGYPRSLSNRADVLIGERRCRVAGSVTMDQLIVVCGDHEIVEGDEVVLIGRQGSEEITAWELARHLDTVAYEIVTRIGARVPRHYVGGHVAGEHAG
jgi:alanine racemase